MKTLPDAVIVKGIIKKVYHKPAEGKKKESFTYRVLCNDSFINVKSTKNSLGVGDSFFSTVNLHPYDFIDAKTNERKKGISYHEAERLT